MILYNLELKSKSMGSVGQFLKILGKVSNCLFSQNAFHLHMYKGLDGYFMNVILFTSISQVLPHLCRWTFNPAVLTKVHGSISSSHTSSPSGAGAVGGLHAAGGDGDNSSNSFAIGDMVQILNDVERVKQLQRGKYLQLNLHV